MGDRDAARSTSERRALERADELLRRWGGAFAGGLAALGEFDATARRRWRRVELTLVWRAAPRTRYELVLQHAGGLSWKGPLLPEAPPLDATETTEVEAILRREGTLWLHRPDGRLELRDLGAGLDAVVPAAARQTRRVGEHALVFQCDGPAGASFCLAVSLSAGAVESAHYLALPPGPGGLLSPAVRDFVDGALRRHGDFGVYGNVTAGLASLVEHLEVSLGVSDAAYHLDASPRDHHGHFLTFDIDRKTGKIGPVAAGHLVPPPEID